MNEGEVTPSTNVLQTYYGTDSPRGSKVVNCWKKSTWKSKRHINWVTVFMVSPSDCSDEEWQKKMKEKMKYEVLPLLKEYHEDFSAWKSTSDYRNPIDTLLISIFHFQNQRRQMEQQYR